MNNKFAVGVVDIILDVSPYSRIVIRLEMLNYKNVRAIEFI